MVRDWAGLGPARSQTAVLTARNAERIELNERMREVLRQEGALTGEVPVTALTKVFQERVDNVLTYQPDDIVQFGRRVRQLGIGANETFTVAAIDRERNILTLERREGEQAGQRFQWDPRSAGATAKHGIVVYRERATSLAPGKLIQWSKNAPRLQMSDGSPLINGRILTVTSVSPSSMSLGSDPGATVTVDPQTFDGQHWDHAYATTVYKSQGLTATHVLVNAEAAQIELFNQKAFVVAISRQRDSLTLYADDRKRFRADIERRPGEKTTVQASRAEAQLQAFRERMQSIHEGFFGSRSSEKRGGRAGGRRALLP